MKKKFTKILGVGLTLALLFSLLLTAAPVSALSQADVSVDPDEISEADADYAIFFSINEELLVGDTITITFPDDTVIDVSAVIDATATIDASPGWRTTGGWGDATVTNGAFTSVPADREVIFTLAGLDVIGETASVRIEIPDGITNPSSPDDYTLTVETNEEDAVESEEYEITPPEIVSPAGVVRVFNPSGIEFQPQTGNTAIYDAITLPAGDDWVIVVGEGRYIGAIPDTGAFEGLTIQAAAGADVVITGDMTMDGVEQTLEGVTFEDALLELDATDIVVDDCTFTGDEDFLWVEAADCVITDSTFEVADTFAGVIFDLAAADVTDCSFTIEEGGFGIVVVAAAAGGTVDGSTFTGGSGVGMEIHDDVDVTGNTFDGLETALWIDGGTLDISGNTIQACEGIAIDINGATDVQITGNTLTGNDDDVLIDVFANDDLVQIMFNDIVDNAGDDDGLLINNAAGLVDLNCANNWWGDPDGPGAAAFSDDVLSTPFLTASVGDTGVLGTGVLAGDLWDERTTVGVTLRADALGGDMEIVGAAQYATNPGAAVDGTALTFWDVCVIDTDDDVAEVTIRLYAPGITADTEAYVWAAARGEWLQAVDEDGDPFTSNLFGGFFGITVTDITVPTIEDLEELPFVLVDPAPATVLATAPVINAPVSGDDTVSLTPTFAWGAVPGADAYYFQLADNANFVPPLLAKLDGDLGRLVVTAYAYRTELPYSTAYYWRVKAVSGTEAAGDLAESDWTSAVFITMAEPEEPIPPVVIEDVPTPIIEQPDIIIEIPDIIVPLPAETPITPTWIYVIIGVGAVLVIALLVLIVRTRRVA